MPWEIASNSVVTEIKDATIIRTGISPGNGNNSIRIELDANASSVDRTYDPTCIVITKGTGAGQGRTILEYDGTNRYAYVNREWGTVPDNTSEYTIMYSCNGGAHVNEGLAQGGSLNTITLNALASDQNSVYLGQIIWIVNGTGADQAKMIIGYNGTTKIATVDSNWIVQPDNTSIYTIMPFPGFVHGRPGANSTDNILIRDIIGNKNDLVPVPYVEAVSSILGFLHTGYYHAHGTSFTYPDHANGVPLASAAGVWATPAATTTIVAANILNVDNYDLHWIEIYDLDTVAEYQIDIFSGDAGSEVRICAPVTQRTSNFSREGPQPLQIPQQLVNTRISAKLSTSVAGVCNCKVKVLGHYYSL